MQLLWMSTWVSQPQVARGSDLAKLLMVMLVIGAQQDGCSLVPKEPWSTSQQQRSLAILLEANVAHQPMEAVGREALPLPLGAPS